MKFLCNDYFLINFNEFYRKDFLKNLCDNDDNDEFVFLNFDYSKKFIKKRKVYLNTRKGVTFTEKKNSLKRDKNNNFLQQYLNLMSSNTNKHTLFKHFNKSIEFFYFIFNDENEEFLKYKNYNSLNFLINNLTEYNDFYYLLSFFLPKYFSMFDIKTKKNYKKKKIKTNKKYRHEITYIPEPKRLKNTLKIINLYSENFKNYNLWERLFWVFFSIMIDDKKSYLLKRRSYIYKKSIKFFINKKNK